MAKEIIELKSEHSGRDLLPVVVIGAAYGVAIALILREVIQSYHQAELADFMEQSVQLGFRIAKQGLSQEKDNDKKNNTPTG